MKTLQQKRDEAAARAAVYASLTLTERLALTNSRRGTSARERARLLSTED